MITESGQGNDRIQQRIAAVKDTLVQAGLTKRHVAVTLHLTPELPIVHGDRVQLQQLMMNLINNAARSRARYAAQKSAREKSLQVVSQAMAL